MPCQQDTDWKSAPTGGRRREPVPYILPVHITDYSAQMLYEETQDPNRDLQIEKGSIPDKEDEPPLYDVG